MTEEEEDKKIDEIEKIITCYEEHRCGLHDDGTPLSLYEIAQFIYVVLYDN